ncbi:MAG: 3-oxoacyl-ACP reductase FabG [Pseudomonadales bacterium]|nr:3-oxoacyl-ACP reductase FabG [Pseudomonadales bacterium]
MSQDLTGRVAIVTGAGRGLGQAYSLALAKAGARIVAADVIDSSETVEQVSAIGGEAIAVSADVTSTEQMNDMARSAVDAFGRIDILVNNAALYGGLSKMSSMLDLSEDEWDTVMDINVKGVWKAARAVVPQMSQQKYGKIINISSGTIFMGMPGLMHYVTSKGAVWAMSRVMSRELGPAGIRVNCVTPGFTMTQASEDLMTKAGNTDTKQRVASMSPLGRSQQEDDLTGTIVFLSSVASDFITGQTLNVDGGVTHG